MVLLGSGHFKSISVMVSDSGSGRRANHKNGQINIRGNILATSVFAILVFCLLDISGSEANPIPGSEYSFPDLKDWNFNIPSSFGSQLQNSDPHKNLNFNTHPGYTQGSSQDWIRSFNTDDYKYGDDDMESSIKSMAIGIGIFILVAFIVTCLICFCCPICIIAKMRQRRRGQVYRNAVVVNVTRNGANQINNAGQPVTTAVHVQNAVSPNTNSGAMNCIAISNNANTRNSPYPVQESVTVVPVINPQPQPAQPFYGQGQHVMNNSYQNQNNQLPAYQPTPNMPTDLPPPYPGLPREMDSANLPYNPYFAGDGANNMTPTHAPSAPYPTKQ